jgi:hypothetical protein
LAKSEIKRETRATSQLKRQNEDTSYKNKNYQRLPNKQWKSRRRHLEIPQGSTRCMAIEEMLKDRR